LLHVLPRACAGQFLQRGDLPPAPQDVAGQTWVQLPPLRAQAGGWGVDSGAQLPVAEGKMQKLRKPDQPALPNHRTDSRNRLCGYCIFEFVVARNACWSCVFLTAAALG
jgi:hypothetical protein